MEAEAAAAAGRRCLVRHAQLLRLDTVSAFSRQRRPAVAAEGHSWSMRFQTGRSTEILRRRCGPKRAYITLRQHALGGSRDAAAGMSLLAQLMRVLIMGTVRV